MSGESRSKLSRAGSATKSALRRLVVWLNALRRHPLNVEKRRKFHRKAEGQDLLKAAGQDLLSIVGYVRDLADSLGNQIIFSESGEWIGGGRIEFLNDEPQPAQCPVKALNRYVASLRNVTVIGGTRYLITDDGRLFHDEESIYSNSDVSIKYARASRVDGNRIRINVEAKSKDHIISGIHLMGEGDTNYFHFIAEILPRLRMVDDTGQCSKLPLLITGGLHENLLAALSTLNAMGHEVIELEPDVSYQVEHLIYPSDTASILNIYGRLATREEGTLSVDWLQRVRAPVLAQVRNAAAVRRRRRLYVRRGKKIRALVNEAAVEEMLIDQGFETLAIDDLSFRAQVKLFAEAEVIVMPTGAAVANVLWCRPGTRVLVLTSDHSAIQHNIWQLLCEASECTLMIMRGPRANKLIGDYDVHDDFEINPDALLSALQSPQALRASA
jgi:capsular polysaccharide biosynthesis protein